MRLPALAITGCRRCGCGRVLLFAVVLLFWASGSLLQSQEPDRQQEDEMFGSEQAASLLQALLLNNRSIDRYDVLFTREVLAVKPSGEVNSYKSRCRLCRDRESKSWLATCAMQTDDWTENDEPLSSKRVFGLLVTPEGKAYLRNPDGIREIPKVNVPRAPKYVGWPALFTLGLEAFPDTQTVESSNNLFWERVILGRRGLASAPTSSGEITVRLAVDHENSDSVEYAWTFDPSTMLPKSRDVAVRLRDSGKRVLKERDRIEWEEMSGVYVPKSIHRSVLRTFANGKNGGSESYETNDDTEFEWKEISADLDESLFTLERFRGIDPQKFLAVSDTAK